MDEKTIFVELSRLVYGPLLCSCYAVVEVKTKTRDASFAHEFGYQSATEEYLESIHTSAVLLWNEDNELVPIIEGSLDYQEIQSLITERAYRLALNNFTRKGEYND